MDSNVLLVSPPSAQASSPQDPVRKDETVLRFCDRWYDNEEDNGYSWCGSSRAVGGETRRLVRKLIFKQKNPS